MAEVKTSQPDSLLNRDQLREVERFQAKFAELERQLHYCVDEFLSVLNRHYFNRENGYLKEQEDNLREIVTIQSKLEALAGNMSTGAAELKSRMIELQQNIHSQEPATQPPPKPDPQTPETSEKETGEPAKKESQAAESTPAPKKSSAAPGKKLTGVKGLIAGTGVKLADTAESGGEISLKLVFEGLKLTDPDNAAALNHVSSSLRKLLYDRKLVGYSKTSLVFGTNRTVGEVLQDLSEIFLSPQLKELMTTGGLVEPGGADSLQLACNEKRELVYIAGR
jgi:hypothetical protein